MRKIWERCKGMSKKKIAAGIGGAVLAAAAVTSVLVYTGKSGTEEALKDNQRYVYAYVSKIEGNEITYRELGESVVTEYLAKLESETEEADPAQEAEENGDGREGAPEREQPSGDRGAEMPQGGEMPEDRMGMSAETVTMLIPVGTTVHTDDTDTTFQRLASGDLLKLLIETGEDGEEVITEIWMLA